MKSINLNAPINHTGYGIASINIIKNLHELGTNLSLFAIGQPHVGSQEEYDLFSKLLAPSEDLDPNAPFIKIWHQFDLLNRIGNRGKYYAFPFFELDTFSAREKIHLSTPDTVFVTSDWAKGIVLNNMPKYTDVCVVPLGVDTSVFDSNKYSKSTEDKYIFLNIGKWEIRKGHDILLQMFKKAFSNNENVELWILAPEHTNGYSDSQELIRWKNMYSSDSRVKLFSGFQSHSEVAELISKSDCGIFPSRAEGWNLELLECMAMNKPVITTYYSAHTEFCNDNNAFLTRTNELEKAYDGKAFTGQGNWAKLGQKELDDMVEKMRYVYQNNIRTNPEGLLTASNYSWMNSAKTLLGCIE